MNKYELIAPCHFGLEAVLKREILDLGYEISLVEDGRVSFLGDAEAICRGNIFLRSAERILLSVGKFRATTFEELFQGTKNLNWEEFLDVDSKFWVTKASSVKSKLFSSSDIQSIVKKAIVDKLSTKYNVSWFEETGNEYPMRVFIYKDEVTITLDTTGVSLHKRGYRLDAGIAPISETLAASLILLTPWNKDRILVDPFCGSGTFLIEAAMIAANIAPGMNREFQSEAWSNIVQKSHWYKAIDEANDLVNDQIDVDIQGFDIDPLVIKYAKKNAENAGVGHLIHFQERAVSELSHSKKYGFIITNPPYGERLEEKAALPALYKILGERYHNLDSWSAFVITSYENVERDMKMQATKNRKIYNGMIKTYFYQFMGAKPPRKNK